MGTTGDGRCSTGTLRTFPTEALRSSNHRVTEASTGREALDSLESSAYDIVFTDLCLPGIGGMDLVKASRRIQPDARVVMVTGHGTIESAVQALRLGADGFLSKPMSLGQLVAPIAPSRRKGAQLALVRV